MSYLPGKGKDEKKKKPEELQMPESSFLASVEYDSENYSLTINFKTGISVLHKFVYPQVFEQMKLSPSKGSYYANNIKKAYPSITLNAGLKVSDLKKAIREARPNAASQPKQRR